MCIKGETRWEMPAGTLMETRQMYHTHGEDHSTRLPAHTDLSKFSPEAHRGKHLIKHRLMRTRCLKMTKYVQTILHNLIFPGFTDAAVLRALCKCWHPMTHCSFCHLDHKAEKKVIIISLCSKSNISFLSCSREPVCECLQFLCVCLNSHFISIFCTWETYHSAS